ncbi:hypothetical protein HMPREF9141_1464 [Prevotella multiformis DSM 16608]|uniref:Uncharacterized protein n=1 Tax=Prevotella multiformis DSM 16608 TaxID=888743 RepID=F0F797_9BACT|nr:hypothetical protein HMPREF9141_1464 [Prevotella multiformis DSM 16608]
MELNVNAKVKKKRIPCNTPFFLDTFPVISLLIIIRLSLPFHRF